MNVIRETCRRSDSSVSLSGLARPVSFAGLMTLYESNFIRLGWLLPGFPTISADGVSTTSGDFPLHLRVHERCRYTTTVHLTYIFDDGTTQSPDPDLYVRVYHDACLVEAMACANRPRHKALRQFDTGAGTELERRWTRNMMLNKWLEYCADRGHAFPPPSGHV